MKYKNLIKRLAGSPWITGQGCAYVYRNGIALMVHEDYKGHDVELWYFRPVPVRFVVYDKGGKSELGRIVLHDLSVLAVGEIEKIEVWTSNTSPAMDREHIGNRTAIFYMAGRYGQARVHFNELRVNGTYHNSHITLQGTGALRPSYSIVMEPVDFDPQSVRAEILE